MRSTPSRLVQPIQTSAGARLRNKAEPKRRCPKAVEGGREGQSKGKGNKVYEKPPLMASTLHTVPVVVKTQAVHTFSTV